MSHRPTQRPAISLSTLGEKKALGEPVVMVTAYDYPSAQVAEEAGVDVVLVGRLRRHDGARASVDRARDASRSCSCSPRPCAAA